MNSAGSLSAGSPRKDHVILIRAFAQLPQIARLAIAGTGPLEPMLRHLASNLGVERRVSFLGFQTDVRQLMQQADAFVLSSRWEGLPVALMEASACELPAIFTETEGSRELLPHSPFPPVPIRNPAALASAMQTLMSLSEPDRRQAWPLGTSANHWPLRSQFVSQPLRSALLVHART